LIFGDLIAIVESVSRYAITPPTLAAAHGWITGPSFEEGRSMTEEIRAEMVANVWKIVVAEGDAVSDGDTLVILESMKMEIPVLSEVEGTVSKLAVAEGDVVQQGDLIAVVE
jgi:acetyl-CoA carboxylase biotin carboxyl carrier protein